MDAHEALVGLNLVADIGSIRLHRLLEVFGSAQGILKASVDQLIQVDGIGQAIAFRITSLDPRAVEQEFALAGQTGVQILTVESDGYPKNLKFIPDPPIVLYCKGAFVPDDILSLAIVGSRSASLYGLEHAEQFAANLAGCCCTVVSGMARGIDTCAHKGALRAGGRTIAVIGSGLDNIYPPENRDLAEQIASRGAIVSEFPLAAAPLKQNFPRRNRLISGLSLGVLVVEACRNSGALITAAFALEQGRTVFAVPGKIDCRTAFGTNRLIKDGAVPVSSVEDILEEFPFFMAETRKTACPVSECDTAGEGLSCIERALYTIISTRKTTLDDLKEKTGLEFGLITNAILMLQLKKKIRQLPGGVFVRSMDAR